MTYEWALWLSKCCHSNKSYHINYLCKSISVLFYFFTRHSINYWLIMIDAWLECHFNAGPVAFWPSKWNDEIGDAMFLVLVSAVWSAKLAFKFMVTSFWYQKLVQRTWVMCHLPYYESCTEWWLVTQLFID